MSPHIVCACVTEDRPEFIPWLLWNYHKQTYVNKSLLIIDSSLEVPAFKTDKTGWVTLHGVAHGMSVAAKRNLALDLAQGDAISWFDDDDWQHPQKLELAAQSGLPLFGAARAWFYNIFTGEAQPHTGNGVLFNSAVVDLRLAKSVRFDEHLTIAADTPWLREVTSRAGLAIGVAPAPTHAWLCHDENMCNPVESKKWGRRVDGPGFDSETMEKLEELRLRLLHSIIFGT